MARNDTSNIFKNYPDALTLGEFAEMLGISQKLALSMRSDKRYSRSIR